MPWRSRLRQRRLNLLHHLQLPQPRLRLPQQAAGHCSEERDSPGPQNAERQIQLRPWDEDGQRIFTKQSVPVDPAILARGLKDGLTGGKTLLTDEEAQAAITAVQNEMRKKQQEKMQEAAAANKKEGDAFLAANKGKEGVVTLPSGLQYKILKEGTGPKPTASDTVVCNYRGTLINGTEFDSSYKRGQPATFPVSGVIKGWTEALQLMPVGSKWQLFIPSDLAYGDRGAGAGIGPGLHAHL